MATDDFLLCLCTVKIYFENVYGLGWGEGGGGGAFNTLNT